MFINFVQKKKNCTLGENKVKISLQGLKTKRELQNLSIKNLIYAQEVNFSLKTKSGEKKDKEAFQKNS
jgi:hypothetical protein